MSNASHATATIQLRDYQVDAVAKVFQEFGVIPAGPPTDKVVTACRSNGARKNNDDGGASEPLASWTSAAYQPPF